MAASKKSVSIKKGDQVKVIAGNDKGVEGKVIEVLTEADRVVVEGVNRVKRHTKTGQAGGASTGGIITSEAPIHISNVMLVNPATGKGDRVGFKFLEAQGGNAPRKVRFFKSNGEVVDV